MAGRARILIGETYFDAELRRTVVVRDELVDRSGADPERTGRFVVEPTDGPTAGSAYVARASALEEPAPAPQPRRGGPPRHAGSVLRQALSRVGVAALRHCGNDEERAIASALAECEVAGADAIRALAKVLLEAARREGDKEAGR